jgi:hypothetical protein
MPEGRKKVEIIETYVIDLATINYRSDMITEMRFRDEYNIEIEDIKTIQAEIDKILENHALYLLVVPGPQGGISQEARDIPMFNAENTQAIGIVAKLLHQRLLGNLFFKFNKAKFSNYKIFRGEKQAVKWLLSQIKS